MSEVQGPDMDLREALYTTRAMRRVRPDPVPVAVQARILDAAVRAPTPGAHENWRFLLVDDPGVKAALGPIYRQCMDRAHRAVGDPDSTLGDGVAARDLLRQARRSAAAITGADPSTPEGRQLGRLIRSAAFLADHWEEVPLFLFAFVQSDEGGGGIFPAVWSAMLAARAEGVGSAITTLFALERAEVFTLLGVSPSEDWQLAACVSMGYPLGRWGVARRKPVGEVTFRNRWGADAGLPAPGVRWAEGETR